MYENSKIKISKKIEELEKSNNKLNNEIGSLTGVTEDLKQDINKELNEKTDLNNDIKLLQSNQHHNNMSIQDLKTELFKNSNTIVELTNKLDTEKTKNVKLQGNIIDLHNDIKVL